MTDAALPRHREQLSDLTRAPFAAVPVLTAALALGVVPCSALWPRFRSLG